MTSPLLRTLSSYVFIHRKLTPGLLSDISRNGFNAVELFCARGHFDYRSAETVRELAAVLRDHNLTLHSLHAPGERDFNLARESAAPLSISDTDHLRRVEAVDEIKRALDFAEYTTFPYFVLHMGSSRDTADQRRFDAAFNSLEQLYIFAKQRGVTIALENTPGALATPANLRQFIADTRLTGLRLCFDIGHANIGDGILPSFEAMRELIATTHIHDNHGDSDEHLPSFEGSIDWKTILPELRRIPNLPLVIEMKERPAYAEPAPATVTLDAARAALDRIEKELANAES